MIEFLIICFFVVTTVLVIYFYVGTFCEVKHRRWISKQELLDDIDKWRAVQDNSNSQKMWDMFYEYIESYGEDSTD